MDYNKIFNTRLRVKSTVLHKDIIEFLTHSNKIEKEYSKDALKDAITAWEWALINKDEKIGIQYIKKVHQLLMRNRNPFIAGKFRKCDVKINGKILHYVSEEILEEELITNVCLRMNRSNGWSRKRTAKETHIAFENIHPFEDGNGRVGRILYNIHRIKMGLPVHIIHEGDEQREYYKWFK